MRNVSFLAARFLAAVAVLSALAGVAAGQGAAGAAAAKPLSADQVKMIQNVPGDALAFVMVGNLNGLAGRADAFIKDILPHPIAKEFNFLKMATEGAGLGMTFNSDAPLAVVLMDPKDYAPELLQKKAPATKPAEDDVGALADKEARERMRARMQAAAAGREEFDNRNLPVLYILSGKDIAKMFPGREAKADGAMTKLTRGNEEAWAVEKDGLVFVSSYKSIIAAMPPKVPAAVAIGKGGEELLARSDVFGYINRPRCEGLRGTPFAKLVWRSFSFLEMLGIMDRAEEGGYHSFNPLSTAMHWFEATRAGTFAQSRYMIGGLTLGKEGPRVELRVPFQEGTPMGKALAAAKELPAGQLTAALPNKPFIFAYGCRKDVLRTPAEQKKKQADGLIANPFLKDMPEEMRKKLSLMIQSIHEQVTEVQHWAGQTKEDGPMAVTSTIRCKDSAALKKTIQDNVPVLEALLNSALEQSKDDKFTLAWYEGNEPAGQVRVDMIQATHPQLDKMLADEDMGTKFKSMMLKIFPGETSLRVRLAAVDKTTLVVTVGGGRRFLNDAVSAARDANSRLELSDDVKSSLALLPANRFALFVINATSGASFVGTAMMSQMTGGGAQIKFKAAPPAVVSLSADKGDLLIVGHVPALVIKRIIGTMSGMGEDVAEEEDDGPKTKPASRPAGGAMNPDAAPDKVSVERRTTVKEVPVAPPKPTDD